MIHALVPWKELLRAAFFLAFIALGLRARRSPRAALTFIAYTIAASLFAGFTQLEAWPFSNWALVHTLRQPSMTRWDFIGIDANGREWLVDPRVLQPIAPEEFDTWMRMKFMRMDDAGRDAVAAAIVRESEEGRRRFLAKGHPGTDDWLLGPLSAPRHFHRAAIWRSAADVPAVPFRRFRLSMSEWDIEHPAPVKKTILYESH